MERQENFLGGLFWGILLSVPLWIAFIGWIKLLIYQF